ncbi:MAG: AtpZ/AtpI family protein [Acidimicrobiia bacterium]
MKHETPHQHVGRAVNEGWLQGGSFVGSILSGTLLGFLADEWLGTDPWLVVTGIVLGSYSGFMVMWRQAKKIDEIPREL